METIKIFTVSQVRSWLNNNQIDGLSDQVITKSRAYSIIHNPYVTEDMPIVCAIYSNEKLAAYTACFPELLASQNRIIYWCTTLQVFPEFEGCGYGVIAIGCLQESIGTLFFDSFPEKVSLLIFDRLGILHSPFNIYTCREKALSNSLIGRCLDVYYNKYKLRTIKKRILNNDITYRYDHFVDGETYDFMKNHSSADLFLRTREMFNWLLKYPFRYEAPIIKKTQKDQLFTCIAKVYKTYLVRVIKDKKLIGVYILCDTIEFLSIMYLYYEKTYQEAVFLSIVEHSFELKNRNIKTTNKDLSRFLQRNYVCPNLTITEADLCFPSDFVCENQNIQLGDGDMFL